MQAHNRRIFSGADVAYRATTARLGIAMLSFLGLFFGLGLIARFLLLWLPDTLSYAAQHTIEELLGSAVYLLSFMLPVCIYGRMTPREQRLPMPLTARLPRATPMIILAGVSIVYIAAVANGMLLRALGGGGSSGGGFHWVVGMPVYQGVLMMISTALVPAFCEELLFRGVALTALRPFGKTTAVLGSAILFGLMHGSPTQLLYTTVAGVVLAVATLESGSLWIAVLIHLFNNLLAVVESILYVRFETATAQLMYGLLELLVIGGGLLCLVVLIIRRRENEQEADVSVVLRHPVRDFLTPTMLAFVIVSVAQMLLEFF